MTSFLAAPASAAETIAAAMAAAYSGNPTLRAERARQRATDEQVPQALSGWRPTVVGNGDSGFQWQKIDSSKWSDTTPSNLSINLTQPIFNGFKTVTGTRIAEATVNAGRQNLLAVEQQVLLDAATAFMNVLRDRAIVGLRQRNVEVLTEQLRASRVRFEVGEITKTDVEQSRARLSLSEAELAVAKANLEASIAFFVRAIGHSPGSLTYPKISKRLPKNLPAAIATAERLNPQILLAAFNEEAARYSIDFVTGDLLPSLSLEAAYQYSREPNTTIKNLNEGTVLGSLTVPLYQGGRVGSQVREAKQVASQRRIEILEASREVREAVVRTWHIFVAAGQTITSLRTQVAANQLALEGVRQEALVGTRTTLDVLDAEQELVNSQVSLVSAQRDQIVAAYQLIASTGQMTARNLGLSVEYYDPEENYRNVRHKWGGTEADTID
jgi:TolC family type I secretion outer membrane protein